MNTMKKTLIFVISVITAMMLCLTGCSEIEAVEENTTHKATAIVIGPRDLSQGLNLNNVKVRTTVEDTVNSGGFISVICVDGNPDLLAANSFEIPEQYASINKTKMKADLLMKSKKLLAELETVKANDPESDILKGLHLAVSSLSDIDSMEKTILIIDDGISTTGEMNFINNLIMADPDELAEQLYERSAIPDFKDITVIWMQMGATAPPQQELTFAQKEKLRAIWRAVIEKTGGTFHYSDAPANSVNKNVDYPYVTPVTFPEDIPITYDVDDFEIEDASDNELMFQTPQILSEEQVKFVGDSDQYIDAAQAIEVITPIAHYMIDHPDITLLLAGTTAGDTTTDYTIQLSQSRADAVRNTLIELGVPSENILTIGLGSGDPWHIYGVGAAMDDPMAGANRKVVMMDATSETARKLLNQ